MSKKEILEIKIKQKGLAKALGVPVDSIVKVELRQGVPVSAFWRNRLRDAELVDKKGQRIDKSIEVSKNTGTKAASPKPSAADNGGK